MKASRYHLLPTLARKREARAARDPIVSFADVLIRQTLRSQELYARRSNASANVDGLARHIARIDAALRRER